MPDTEYRNPDAARKAADTNQERKAKPPRKKAPPKLAVINQNGCTGCEICISFCPVDCIEVVPGADHPNVQQLVEVDLARCIGCSLCAKNCPWDTIDMITHDEAYRAAPEVTLRSVCEQKTAKDVSPEAAA